MPGLGLSHGKKKQSLIDRELNCCSHPTLFLLSSGQNLSLIFFSLRLGHPQNPPTCLLSTYTSSINFLNPVQAPNWPSRLPSVHPPLCPSPARVSFQAGTPLLKVCHRPEGKVQSSFTVTPEALCNLVSTSRPQSPSYTHNWSVYRLFPCPPCPRLLA